MVYDLLVNKKARCALDIAKRYQSIVDILLVHFGPTKKKKVSISARKLTKNSLGQPDGVELTEDYMKREIGNTQIDLFSIEKRLKKGPVELLSERQEIAIELVRMREMFHQFLGEIEENASEEEYIWEIIEDFEEALHNDTEWMASIVVALVDDGGCENVWKFIDRLKDFAQKIRAFFETKNHNSLKGPHILFPVPDESDEEDAEGDISFDTSLN